MLRRERLLELKVLPRSFWMPAKVIAKGQVPRLLLAPALAQVDMMRTWPTGRLLKEGIDAIEVPERHVNIAEACEET
jgi:hypothetical protein